MKGQKNHVKWTCPGCGRQLPRQLRSCPCRRQVPKESSAGGFAAQAYRVGSRINWAMGGWGLAICLFVFLAFQQLPAGTGVSGQTASVVGEEAIASTGSMPFESSSGEDPTLLSDLESPVGELVKSASLRPELAFGGEEKSHWEPEPLSIEDVVQSVLPGVVLVEGIDQFGSGFFVQPGLVATNYHVVARQYSIKVKLHNGVSVRARILKKSVDHDLAVLELMNKGLEHEVMSLGTVNDLHTGHEVVAIGTPLGLRNTATRGIVSAIRTVENITLVQTDAALNPGNSGGPLLDERGRVIGINTIKFGDSLALAVAIDHLTDLLAGHTLLPALPIAAITDMKETSDMDAVELARHRFGAMVEALAIKANRVDVLWSRFRNQCGACADYEGPDGRDWFVVWDDYGRIPYPESVECQDLLQDFIGRAEAIGREMWSAEQEARREGIEEETRSFVRRRFEMEWSGWAS